jgi:hypothetical protein
MGEIDLLHNQGFCRFFDIIYRDVKFTKLKRRAVELKRGGGAHGI